MSRHDDSYGTTRLYVGHMSSRTRSRDLEDIFSRYGRIRHVDMKRDFAFVEFSDPRDADDARYSLNGRDVDGSRIVVEFSRGVPRGGGRNGGPSGGSREYLGRGPPPGSGLCFNCGLDGHWARDCKAGDWKNKCYRCGERGHIERDCQNSPKKVRGRSYSRTPSPPRRGRSRSRSYSRGRSYRRGRSYSRTPSPPRRGRSRSRSYSRGRSYSRSRSPSRRERSPRRHKASPPPSKGRKPSPSPADRSPEVKDSPSPRERVEKLSARSGSPVEDDGGSLIDRSPAEENGNGRSRSPTPSVVPSPGPRDNVSPDDDEGGKHDFAKRQ